MGQQLKDKPSVVWARKTPPPKDQPVFLWDSFDLEDQHADTISLPSYVELHAEEIRSRLLAFLCEAKSVESEGQTLEDSLRRDDGFSVWWVSFPSLKRPGQISIPIACKLIALEMIVGPHRLEKIRVISDDKSIATLILRSISNDPLPLGRTVDAIWRAFVHPIRALGSLLRYIAHTRAIPKNHPLFPEDSSHRIAFFDYLPHLRLQSNSESLYVSPYWADVPNLVARPFWYHIYPRNVDYRDIRSSFRFVDNVDTTGSGNHFLFLERTSFSAVLQVLRQMIRHRRVHTRFRPQLRRFALAGSGLHLWNVFEDEWDDSILGTTGMRHLLLLWSTESFVREMPTHSKIFYLMENQPWEVILNHFLEKYMKGPAFGFAHSTIRFWDLRYFSDPRENPFLDSHSHRPSPTRILLNGDLAKSLLIDNGFPETSLSVVEASRYNYLRSLEQQLEHNASDIVVLGDSDVRANNTLLEIFRKALTLHQVDRRVLVRSHPICPLTNKQLGPLVGNISTDSLLALLKSAAVVITTAGSSSSADSAALGIPTIVVLDAKELNNSPLRGKGITFEARNADELSLLLRSSNTFARQRPSLIFTLDSLYPRWSDEVASPDF